MEKRTPKVKILVFPTSEIDRVAGVGSGVGESFAVQDIFSGQLAQQQGEGGDSADAPGFDSLKWQGQQAFDYISDSLDFVRFMKDGKVIRGVPGITENEGLGGWTLKPRSVPVNCVVTPGLPADPNPDNKYQTLTWRKVKGDGWESYVSAEAPYRKVIRHRAQRPDAAVEIASEPLDYPAGVEVELIWDGVAAGQTKDPGFRLVLIDKKLSIVWRRIGKTASKPTLERWVNSEKNNGWEVWKRLDDAAPVEFKGRSLVRLQIVGGRPVLDLDDKSYLLMETRKQPSPEPVPPVPVETVWPKAAMRLSVFGVDVLVGVSVLKFQGHPIPPSTRESLEAQGVKLPAGSPPQTGALERTVRAPFSRNAEAENTVEGYTAGWKPAGTSVFLSGVRGANEVTYVLVLMADRKGRSSPFVTNAMLNFTGDMAQQPAPPIDLRVGSTSLKYSSGEPELLPTSEVQIELSRSLLDQYIPDWQNYIKPFAPIRILATWDYDDEHGNIVEGEWERVFEGYIATPNMSLAGYAQQTLNIVARDPIMRLKSPAGFVDERYAPLDILFAQKGGAPLYDGECVKYLLETELGGRIANTINGNGDPQHFGDPLAPLLSNDSDVLGYFQVPGISKLSTQGQFKLAPPFGSDVYTWIHDTIAKPLSAVFYWGYSPLTPVDTGDYSYGTQPLVPMYGRIDLIMNKLGGTPKTLPDAIYLEGDANDLIASATVESLTDKLFNEVVVWGAKPGGSGAALFPTLAGGRARLAPEHPNSAENSWRRVMTEQHDFIGKIAGRDYAEGMAIIALRQFEDLKPRNVTVVMPRGDESLRWGQKIKPKMQASGSDLTLGINNETFRIKRISHSWDFTGGSPERAFTTELVCRPLSVDGV